MRAILLAIFLLALPAPAPAAEYPMRPVRMIVPFPAGGGVDLITRFTTDILSQALGQPFIVDNRPGAGANLGADLLAKSAPDGYTIGTMTIATPAINPSLSPHLPSAPQRPSPPPTTRVTRPT